MAETQWPRGIRRGSRAARLLRGGLESPKKRVCLPLVLYVVKQRSLRRAYHSYRGVLPSMVCLKVGITRGYFTRYSPASERAASKQAMPIIRKSEKAGHSAL
jgi:hypothetical protein